MSEFDSILVHNTFFAKIQHKKKKRQIINMCSSTQIPIDKCTYAKKLKLSANNSNNFLIIVKI